MFRGTSWCLFIGFQLTAVAIRCPGQELEQEPIVIKGEQSAPGTIYIAPWKKLGGALDPEPLEAEFEIDAQPLDREVFLRELELQRQDLNDPHTGSGELPPAGMPPAGSN